MAEEKQNKIEEKKTQEKEETKKITEKSSKVAIAKKESAVVNATRLRISTKDSIAICDMIRNKTTEQALKMLEEVLTMKRIVKMNNREVPHKKGKGIMAGRYPLNATKEFIRLIKNLNANAIVNEIPIEEAVISCKANVGSRAYRRMGQRFKSTNLTLELKVPKVKNKAKKVNKTKSKK